MAEQRHIVFSDYEGDPNLGFHGVLTEDYAVLAPGFKDTQVLDVETVCEVYIANTDLAGLFTAGNDNGILLPETVSDHERDQIEDAGISTKVIDSNHTALGNLLLVTNSGCYLAPSLEHRREEIADFLDVQVTVGTVAGLNIVGSAGIATDRGVLLHRETEEEELEAVEEALDVPGDIGTVNFGSPYVGTGIIANSDVALVGNDTKGPETARIEKALGFLDQG
jgi:translation initiation factor 6